jgi:anti-sigma B factor antagonist
VSTPFTVEAEELDGGVRAFTLVGELDHATAPELREPLDAAIESGTRCVLIDLSDCTFIDSTGLSVIVHAHSALIEEERSGQLEICCPDPQVRRLLEITGVDRALGLHQTRDEALEALQAAAR